MRLFNVVSLPRTHDAFDVLVNKVIKKYHLTDKHHAAAIISVAIQHLPNHQLTTTMDYLGGWVVRNISYNVAKERSSALQHKFQVEQLESILKNEPNNQQAIDELSKAAKEGSELARAALDRVLPVPENTVTPINAS